jgi:alpha-galactosidase
MLDEDDPTRLFNLADPEARRWLTDTLIDMIRDNGIDIYRQDFNMDPLEYWRRKDTPDRKGITELKYIEGLYELWDALLAEFPDLWIDNCSSGGRRLDLETSMRSVTLWRSDTGCFPETEKNRVTVWNHNQILGLSQYLPYHDCAVWDIDAYTVRSTSTQGMAANFHIFDPDFDFEQGARVLEEVDDMRGYWDGDFYPLTEATLDESVWSAYQLDCGDHGAVYAFRRAQCEEPENTLPLAALDRDAQYAVTLMDERFNKTHCTMMGAEMACGVKLTIPQARNSLIMKYRKI